MADIRSTVIVPISVYCFVLAGYFFSLAVNVLLSNKAGLSSTNFCLWGIVLALIILTGSMIAVGRGILHLNRACWKTLFFSLAISVSSLSSFVIILIVFSFIDVKVFASVYQTIQHASVSWFAFLGFFLSETIVLYYLTKNEVVSCFGEIGPLISPF